MSTHITLFLILGLVIGIIIGVVFTTFFNPKLRRYNVLKKELETTKEQMANQKQMLVKHFSHSAELLDKMAKDFRRLYQHMAENSTSILADVDIKDPQYFVTSDHTDCDLLEEREPEEQPKDYPSSPSGILKKEKKSKR